MTKPKTKEVTTKEENAVATHVPDFMKEDGGLGTENLDTNDLEIPRLILLQSLSPQVTEGDEKAGSFFHTILEESLVGKNEPLRIVPLYAEIRYMLWKPRWEGGGILARAELGEDGDHHWNPANTKFTVKPSKDRPDTVVWETTDTVRSSGLDQFGSSNPSDPNSQPAAVKMHNFVVVLPDFPELGPMVYTFQRGTSKTGANFATKVKFADGAPSFGQIFEMKSKLDNSGQGDYYGLSLTRSGYVTDHEQYKSYKKLYENFKSMGVKIKDEEGAQDDGATTKPADISTPEGGIEV